VHGAAIRALGEVAAAGDFENGAGNVVDAPVFGAYVDRLAMDFDGSREITAVWDSGNGAAGPAMVALAGAGLALQHDPGRP